MPRLRTRFGAEAEDAGPGAETCSWGRGPCVHPHVFCSGIFGDRAVDTGGIISETQATGAGRPPKLLQAGRSAASPRKGNSQISPEGRQSKYKQRRTQVGERTSYRHLMGFIASKPLGCAALQHKASVWMSFVFPADFLLPGIYESAWKLPHTRVLRPTRSTHQSGR